MSRINVANFRHPDGTDDNINLDSSGRVGIGTESPGAILDVAPDANRNIQILGRAGTTYGVEIKNATAFTTSELHISAASAGSVVFNRDTTESARIDSSGRLLIGSTSSRLTGYGNNCSLQLEGTSQPNAAIASILNSNDAIGPSINLTKTRGTSLGSNATVQADDNLGIINFSGGDGTDIRSHAARISCQADGTPGVNDMPGRLVFATTADGANSPTERLRIANTGAIGLSGTNYGSSGQVLTSNGAGSTPSWQEAGGGIPSGAVQYFAQNSAPSGWLKANGAAISRTTYAALFAAIGTTFGSGDNSTTFNLPDLRGEFIRGFDDGRGADSGRSFGSSQSGMVGPHNHPINDPGHSHSYSAGDYANIAGGDANASRGPSGKTTGGSPTGITISNNTGTESRPRNIALLACIKF